MKVSGLPELERWKRGEVGAKGTLLTTEHLFTYNNDK
jgi:hypothetical protein